jgi:5-methyltetrahydrofolate--homocysteine methyltransferase
MDYLNEIAKCVISGNDKDIEQLTQLALDSGIEAKDILNSGLIAGMDVVGEKFARAEIFVPEVLMSAEALHVALEVIKQKFPWSDFGTKGNVVIGTVQGDLHDIGKNLVVMMLEGAGFKVKDLGNDVDPQLFVEAAKEFEADIVGMSTLLTTTMSVMSETIKAIASAGLRDKVKVIIGGAPVFQGFADSIGADGYAPDSSKAVSKCKELI